MPYLLHTDFLVMLNNQKNLSPNHDLAAWATANASAKPHISAISIMCLQAHIAIQQGAQRTKQQQWLEQQVIPTFKGHILPFELETVLNSSTSIELHAYFKNRPVNAMIAATAMANKMDLMVWDTSRFPTIPGLKVRSLQA